MTAEQSSTVKMSRSTTLSLVGLLVLIAVLAWSTLRSQVVECTACVEFGGGRNCAVASAASEAEALRSAHTTACGPLTSGMNESLACGNRPPAEQSCRAR